MPLYDYSNLTFYNSSFLHHNPSWDFLRCQLLLLWVPALDKSKFAFLFFSNNLFDLWPSFSLTLGEREPHPRNCHQVGTWTSPYRIPLMMDVGPSLFCNWYTSRTGGSGMFKKGSWASLPEQASEQCSFMICAALPVSRLLLWLPLMTEIADYKLEVS